MAACPGWSKHIERLINTVYGLLAFLGRGIVYESQDDMLQLDYIFVRRHLEYSIPFWSPHYRKHVGFGECAAWNRLYERSGKAGQTGVVFLGAVEAVGSPDRSLENYGSQR